MNRIKTLKYDTILAFAVVFLVVFGLIMITSIGVTKSISLSAPNELYPNCSDANVDCYLLFKKHLFRLFVGIGALFFAFKLPMKFWRKTSKLMYVAMLLVLVIVLVMGSEYTTFARSWLVIFNTSIQPSEFAKLAIIIYLSYWFSKRQAAVESFHDGFLPFCMISGLMVGLVILQKDFGSTLVLSFICLGIYIAAGAKWKHIGVGVLVALLFSVITIASVEHVRERFYSFMNVGEVECRENACWQSEQANIAVGSGGLWGQGLTQGVQKSYWLPQASDDFIFAASAEELGFLRIVFVIIAYVIIAIRGYTVANYAKSSFERYVAIGITTWLVFQAFINIAVNMAIMPVTGITLPFVSYGGSSLVASLVGVGILLNISQNTSHYAYSFNRRGHRRSRNTKPVRYRRA